MLKIRLQRIGRKNDPSFRVVITDSKNAAKSGKFLEVVGTYNPKSGETSFVEDRINYWVGQGAQVSGTVHNFLVDKKVLKSSKKNVLPLKTKTEKRKVLKSKK